MILNMVLNRKLILASQSPRRQELLKQLDIPFEVIVKPDVDEIYPKEISNDEVPEFLAKLKAKAYKEELINDEVIVITADTIVVCSGEILGKPKDSSDAIRMLTLLSNNEHEVITGVALTSSSKQHCFSVSTKVFFKDLSDDEINYYVHKYKPFDKAGSYGIQEWIGMVAIERIEGSYYNVVGLPVQKLYQELQKF